MRRQRLGAASALLLCAIAATLPAEAAAQDQIPGVRLGLLYQVGFRPGYALRLTGADPEAQTMATRIEAVLVRDLDNSDRFEQRRQLSPGLASEGTIDFALWKQLGVDWLLTGEVRSENDGFVVDLQLHDVLFGEPNKQVGRFAVPPSEARGFRMAVHTVADEIVRWIFAEPGMAASRIAFVRKGTDGNGEIYLVDSDGENLERVTSFGTITVSPAWSIDGTRLAYTSYKSGEPLLYELNLTTGREQQIAPQVGSNVWTPSYHPNGQEILFSVSRDDKSEILRYNIVDRCCLKVVSSTPRRDDMSPAISPDGSRMAFLSNRLNKPQIYVMPTDGGVADPVSPYDYREPGEFHAPDWSPVGDRIAFHGRMENSRGYQILLADASGRGLRLVQLTADGNNEDPSWAPDGRHLVFSGTRQEGTGLFVADTGTGRIRPLVTGLRTQVPDWSPSLAAPLRESLREPGH
ncbi:MAG: PD40 domain-containing protein [Gemmatimonadetes bacterium]|nr:PD40 domain-containing protein [Gemmatimonadota bacterium]